MGFKKNIIRDAKNANAVSTQVVVDEDFNVPDSRPDMEGILCTRGFVCVDSVRIIDKKMEVKGHIEYGLLYSGTQPAGLQGTMEFEELLNLNDDIAEGTPVCDATLEDLNIRMIHSRKINVRGVVSLNGYIRTYDEVNIPFEYDGENLEVKKEEINCVQMVIDTTENMRLRKVFEIPQNKPDIGEIIYQNVDTCILSSQMDDEGLHLETEVTLSVLYKNMAQDEYVWLQMQENVPQTVEISRSNISMLCYVTPSRQSCKVEIRPDFDGEERCFEVDAVYELRVEGYEESKEEIISDCYMQTKNVDIKSNKRCMYDKILKNNIRCRAQGMFKVDDPRNFRICVYTGRPRVEDVSFDNGQMQISGTLDVCVVGLSEINEREELVSTKQTITFAQTMDASGIYVDEDHATWKLNACLEKLSVSNAQDGLDVRAVISLDVILKKCVTRNVIDDIVVSDMNEEWYMGLPQMIGYIVGKNEKLWDIAKKNHTTVKDIMECNQLSKDSVKENDRLVIYRKNM